MVRDANLEPIVAPPLNSPKGAMASLQASTRAANRPVGMTHRYIPSLDGLRAVAVILVMFVHSSLDVVRGGWIGVDIFFVLSGYLITSILLAEWSKRERIDLKHFYLKRALRLLPAVFVFVVITTAMALLFSRERSTGEVILSALATLLYVANWASALQWVEMGPFEHMWSLAIEEQFYLVWPALLVVLLVRRIDLRTLTLVIGGLILASLTTRAIIFANVGEENPWRTYAGFDTRADTLLVGCLLAVVMASTSIRPPAWLASVAAALCLAALLAIGVTLTIDDAYGAAFNYGGYTVLALIAGGLIWSIVVNEASPVARLLALPVLVWIGRISYALYLWHLPVFRRFNDTPGIAITIFCFAASFALAIGSWYLVEAPFLRLKSRLRPSTTGTTGDPDAMVTR